MELENLEHTTRQFIEKLIEKDDPPLYTLQPQKARQVLENIQKPEKHYSVQQEDKIFPCGPDNKVSVRIIRPRLHDKLPVILYFHGGGWILGNKATHHRLICDLALGTQAAVVFVDFSPSPEAPFPKALDECYAAVEYVIENAQELNLDGSRIAVSGDSAGGNIATEVVLKSIQQGLHITCQALFYPVTDGGLNTPSYKQFSEGPWLTKPAMEWFWNAYEPQKNERKQFTRSPLMASIEQLKKMPPTLILTAENDVLRDEGEAYAHKLIQAGVDVTAVRLLGTIHDFMLLNALSHTPATQCALSIAYQFFQKNLILQKVHK